MGRHKTDIKNLVESIYRATKERKKEGIVTIVRIIPEDGAGYSPNHHSLEKFLWDEQIPFYLDCDGSGSRDDYIIDLRKVKVIYPAQEVL